MKNINDEIDKIRKDITDNADMFDMLDLKLHNICYYNGGEEMIKQFPLISEKDMISLFSDFCDESYENFKDEMMEHDIDISTALHYIGHTSKFYLYENTQYNHRTGLLDVEGTLLEILYELSWDGIVINDDCTLNKEDSDETILEDFSNDLYASWRKIFEPMETLYNTIIDFKNHQVEYYKDYLENLEEDEREEKEERDKEMQESKQVCEHIRNLYHINNYDMNILKENISCWN